jgi:hypothetical protein
MFYYILVVWCIVQEFDQFIWTSIPIW